MNGNIFSGAETADDARPKPRPEPPRRILVVEDDSSLRQLNADVLMRFGYQVDTAQDGAVAWDVLQRGRYDLMVTDHNMPKMSGVELLKKLRAAGMALPVIMATAMSPEKEMAADPLVRPDALLLKPYTIDELMGTVRKILHPGDEMREPIVSLPPPGPEENRLPL